MSGHPARAGRYLFNPDCSYHYHVNDTVILGYVIVMCLRGALGCYPNGSWLESSRKRNLEV